MRLPAFLLWLLSCSIAHACSNIAIVHGQSGSQTSFAVEIADGFFSRARGLMFRDTLPPQSGMLFLYEEEVQTPFWMKNVSLPLDLIFADADGKIVSIYENARPYDETPIFSPRPFTSVLEINAGAAKSAQIKLGDNLARNNECN